MFCHVIAVEQKFVLIGRNERSEWSSYLTFLRHSSTPELGESDVRLRLHGTLDVEKRKVRFFFFVCVLLRFG